MFSGILAALVATCRPSPLPKPEPLPANRHLAEDFIAISAPRPAPAVATRRTDLDGLRSFAMLLGVALHAAASFVTFPWPVRDTERSDVLLLLIGAVHGFRMPLFFLLSGYFTMLVTTRRGLASLLGQRFRRIFLPLIIAAITIVPLDRVIEAHALRTNRPEPALVDMLSGDEAVVSRRLASPGAAARRDAFWGLSPLAWATMRGDPGIVAAVLDAGAEPDPRDSGGNTPLHRAAYLGRDAAARILIERGADPATVNAVGRMPAAMMSLPADVVSEFAPLTGMNPVSVDDVLAGRERLRALLPTGPNPQGTLGGPLDRATLAWSGILSAEWLRLRFGGWSIHLVQTDVFHHLWFLWFLCWLVAAFAILAVTGLLPTGRDRWWLAAVSCVPQIVMGMSMAAGYGPDSSFGILPRPHLLAFYACFFFFGVATFAGEGLDTRLGRHWRLLLPTAIVLFVAGIATMNDRLLASVLQPAYAWTMSLGLIGLFARFGSRPSPLVSWLADASYWMYIVHVPLVMAAQLVVRTWAVPAGVKFLLVMATVTPLLLLSYRYGVRYTAIGRLLNGPRGTTSTARMASAT
jgi:peptidoglycan/LPS O-acetylase OafA/YrhL